MTDHSELRALLAKATAGPYTTEAFNEVFCGEADYAAMILAGDNESIVAQSMKDHDATAFAVAVNALPGLLTDHDQAADTIAKLEAENAGLRKGLEEAPQPYDYMSKSVFTSLPVSMRSFVDAHKTWMKKARTTHPDQGGSTEAMARLNAARDQAMVSVA